MYKALSYHLREDLAPRSAAAGRSGAGACKKIIDAVFCGLAPCELVSQEPKVSIPNRSPPKKGEGRVKRVPTQPHVDATASRRPVSDAGLVSVSPTCQHESTSLARPTGTVSCLIRDGSLVHRRASSSGSLIHRPLSPATARHGLTMTRKLQAHFLNLAAFGLRPRFESLNTRQNRGLTPSG